MGNVNIYFKISALIFSSAVFYEFSLVCLLLIQTLLRKYFLLLFSLNISFMQKNSQSGKNHGLAVPLNLLLSQK